MVETLLSRIIKARDGSGVAAFDFREILVGSGEKVGADDTPPAEEQPVDELGSEAVEESPEPEEPPEPEVDPLEELEETIRNRLLEAERHAQELEKEAYEKGYAQGQKDGVEYGRKSMKIVQDHLQQLLSGLQAAPETILGDYRNWLLASCLAVLREIVPMTIQIHPQALLHLIDGLLEEAAGGQTLTIHLNPADLDLLEKNTDLKERMQSGDRRFAVKADPGVKRGGCRAENDIQLLDATIETQLALFEEALRGHEPDKQDSDPSE
jgi:flagellar assembly protein FliH